ncbi:hypothetical protein GCM10010191_02380 [Actinomadura vinacea]|uniref:Uncharacterized protein n=1 Tax=Actinomadura vinacea TaxID=115336 RepID=A0ABP5VBW6_9ACTN
MDRILGLKSLNAIAIAVLFSGVVGALISRSDFNSAVHTEVDAAASAVTGGIFAASFALVSGFVFARCVVVYDVGFGRVVGWGTIGECAAVISGVNSGEPLKGLAIGSGCFVAAVIVGGALSAKADNTAGSATSGAADNTAFSDKDVDR